MSRDSAAVSGGKMSELEKRGGADAERDGDIHRLMKHWEGMFREPGLTIRREAVEPLARLAITARDERDAERYVPGEWECPKCRFTLQKNFLHAQTGTVSVNDEEVREVCPNDGATLERQTWAALARQTQKIALEEMTRAAALEAENAALQAERDLVIRWYQDDCSVTVDLAELGERARKAIAPEQGAPNA
jgi:hypothetical protein